MLLGLFEVLCAWAGWRALQSCCLELKERESEVLEAQAQPAQEVGFPLQRVWVPAGTMSHICVGFNTYLKLSVEANLLKPETKFSSGKAQKEENSQTVISGYSLILGLKSPIPAFLQGYSEHGYKLKLLQNGVLLPELSKSG